MWDILRDQDDFDFNSPKHRPKVTNWDMVNKYLS